MPHNTDDLRIREIKELAPPSHLVREFPCTERASATTFRARQSIHRILVAEDDRLLVVIGPCSIHDAAAAREYAGRLAAVRERLAPDRALAMYTLNAARFGYAEHLTGNLAPGLAADLVVLDRDPLDGARFRDCTVLQTWRDGSIVYGW